MLDDRVTIESLSTPRESIPQVDESIPPLRRRDEARLLIRVWLGLIIATFRQPTGHLANSAIAYHLT